MDVANVALEVARDTERPFAVFALIGLLAGVRPQVSRKVRRPGEYLTAELARVPVFRLQASGDSGRVGGKCRCLRLDRQGTRRSGCLSLGQWHHRRQGTDLNFWQFRDGRVVMRAIHSL